MPQSCLLTAPEREFFRRLARFVFSNPFSREREQLLLELVPGMTLPALQGDQLALYRVAAQKLQRFDVGGAARLDDFTAEDRPLLEAAYLYLTYIRYLEKLDRLIECQLLEETPLEVWFAEELYTDMGRRGFGDEAIGRYFAFFYQLRRAFYFIQRSLPGESPSMRGLRLALWNNTFTYDMHNFNLRLWNRMEDFSTLLLGETGTGKGSAASAIGRSSFIPYAPARRRFVENFAHTFIALNLSQFPETLIESELFGHQKGAFTGAINNHEGVFERCSAHGALFLDEIGEVSAPVQIKLLQVLQERTFVSLGSHAPKRFKGRVIGATNRPLSELRGQNGLRDDLFYRLCSDVIVVPPLRVRLGEAPGELEQLVAILIGRMTGEASPPLIDHVLTALRRDLSADYGWPGNVRELEQAVRRILLTGAYGGDRGEPAAATEEEAFLAAVRAGSLSAEQLLAGYCALLYRRHPVYVEVAQRTGLDRRTVRKYLDEAERQLNGLPPG
ncbi:sigma-54-dependent transcriptional regulator [Pseudogulbenkiania subflava]|uniref:Sigma-54 interaction domain-containing protein n=1 Tax=Pseudogulbenkiania subflava DSM 22618 TaxID=1123014 RepID=A0A1Y6C0A5_9NEIS|nr:sigma 54-interacting transcriptional regulator [Pseudogulbenkiania subflava]SMF38862.1 Sigma-54 interaction domain-containing protein [Pseudogulbenkiania subflava DSM 22618]